MANPKNIDDMTATQRMAKHHLEKLIGDLRQGRLAEDKLSLAFENPVEFLDEYLSAVPDRDRNEVNAIVRKYIVTGFFRVILKNAGKEIPDEE